MRILALQDSTKPNLQNLSTSLSADPRVLDAFLRAVWVIEPDPVGYEFVRAPELQVAVACERQAAGRAWYLNGDCDDAATLAAAICAAWGFPSSLIAIRMPGDAEFSHVFLRVAGVDIDPIVPASLLPIVGVAEFLEVPIWQEI